MLKFKKVLLSYESKNIDKVKYTALVDKSIVGR